MLPYWWIAIKDTDGRIAVSLNAPPPPANNGKWCDVDPVGRRLLGRVPLSAPSSPAVCINQPPIGRPAVLATRSAAAAAAAALIDARPKLDRFHSECVSISTADT